MLSTDHISLLWSRLLPCEGCSRVERKSIEGALCAVQERTAFSPEPHSSFPSVQRSLLTARDATVAELTALILTEIRSSRLEGQPEFSPLAPLSLTAAEISACYSTAMQLCNDGERSEYAAAGIGMFLMFEIGLTLEEVLTMTLQQVEIQTTPRFRILSQNRSASIEFSQFESMHALLELYLGSRMVQLNARSQKDPEGQESTLLGTRRGPYSRAWFLRILAQVWRAAGIKKPLMTSALRITMIRQLLRRGAHLDLPGASSRLSQDFGDMSHLHCEHSLSPGGTAFLLSQRGLS
jgi:hypothetical protein